MASRENLVFQSINGLDSLGHLNSNSRIIFFTKSLGPLSVTLFQNLQVDGPFSVYLRQALS